MPYDPDKDVVTYHRFKGLRNTVGPESFEEGDLDAALNVDLTDAERLRRRRGYTSVTSGNYHSVWSDGARALVVSGTTLYEVMPDLSLRSVRAGLTAGQRMHCTSIGARIYFSNDVETGVLDNHMTRSWGIAPPLSQPSASLRGGSLRAGKYQFAVTFLRSDGQESGTPGSDVIDLSATGGIGFSDIPVSTDPDVTYKRLYISPVDGDQVYAAALLTNADTTAMYEVERVGALPLRTQFLTPPPAGQHLAVLGGRVLLAAGSRLVYTLPWAAELLDPRVSVPMPSRITLVAPMVDGLYLGCESEIGWLAGLDPSQWNYRRVADYGAIPGTLAYGPAEHFVAGGKEIAMVVATKQGICLGLPGGGFQNLTRARFNYPVMDQGAGIIRDNGGSIQYVATLQGTEQTANVAL